VPKNLEEALCRTVLIERIPQSATVSSILGKLGAIRPVEQVRVLKRGDSYPGLKAALDVHQAQGFLDDVNKYIMKGYRAKIPPGLHESAWPIALVEAGSLEDAVHLMDAITQFNALFVDLLVLT
jgi:hypothetical protein